MMRFLKHKGSIYDRFVGKVLSGILIHETGLFWVTFRKKSNLMKCEFANALSFCLEFKNLNKLKAFMYNHVSTAPGNHKRNVNLVFI